MDSEKEIKKLKKLKKKYDKAYYDDGIQLIPDYQYDIISDIVKQNSKNTKKIIPAKPGKVKLPIPMLSLNKIKNFKIPKNSGNKFLLMDKLDGVSCLIYKGKAFTRGDGNYGFEISNLIEDIPYIENYAVRGELVIERTKLTKEFSNTRTMVCSFVNRNIYNENIDFVAYELISLYEEDYNLIEQFNILKKLNKFKIVYYEGPLEISEKKAENFLNKRISESEYDIDGIVLSFTEMVRDSKNLKNNPKYSLAFKKNIKGMDSEVLDIIWNVGKTGSYTPLLIIEPVIIDGTTINKVTGHNINYLKEKGIGIGSLVEIIKSGNIIPHVSDVFTKSNNFNFDVEILNNKKEKEIKIQKLLFFSKFLKIQGIGISKAKDMIEKGITVDNIITKGLTDYKNIFCNQEKNKKSNLKILNSIYTQIKIATLEELLTATMFFGNNIGISKISKMDLTSSKVKKFKGYIENNYNVVF